MALRTAMRWLRYAACAAGFGWVACGSAVAARSASDATPLARTRAVRKPVALSPWEQAERSRDALEGIAEGDRTRADYTRVMDLYRTIYHDDPADVHAPAAVNAVAELLAEQGRGLHDAKSLAAAVGQYEFLRKQYPGSSLRVQALLAEGEIEEDDLGDRTAAREKYKLLLKDYARSEQADEAKAGLASLEQGTGNKAGSREQGTGIAVRANGPIANAAGQPAHHDGTAIKGVHSGSGWDTAAASGAEDSTLPPMAQTSGVRAGNVRQAARGVSGDDSATATPISAVPVDATPAKRSDKPALVTGIRHWSTSTYTRVAIDLGDSVTYEAARVPHPDRIYFDLHGTRLAPELVGKSFSVTDDGFLKRVRAAQYTDDVTRVVLDVSDVSEYSAFLLPNPYRLIIDIHGGKGQGTVTADREQATAIPEAPAPRAATTVKPTLARPVPNAVGTRNTAATAEVADLSDLPGRVDATSRPTSKPISAVVPNLEAGAQAGAAAPVSTTAAGATARTRRGKSRTPDAASGTDATPAREATPMADGETSLVRALGLKIGRIVIDAGHGGHDSGTLGADGIEEKDVVLDVALRLGKLLHDRLGAEIIYTRSDDTFIPLETRTAIANKAQADLFISIHANSSQDASARGVETYYLNFTSDPTALDVAARENAVSDQSIHQLSDLVKKIALKDKISESREFASDVESSLYAGLAKGNPGLKDRGVKKAPFVVLIGANMPSILAEISFVTNPKDAEQLEQPDYRERVAESLYRGVARYESGLSGTKALTERAAVGQ